jgi:hypothetical protein
MDAYGGSYGGHGGYGSNFVDAEPSQQIMVRNVSDLVPLCNFVDTLS